MQNDTLRIVHVVADDQVEDICTLFKAYKASIETDLCFQQFEKELASLPGDYAPPSGCLLMAEYGDRKVGCIALRRWDAGVCEMKRLYVDPDFRGQGFGIRLIGEVIDQAMRIGYRTMLLDTLPSMQKAVSLYESLGFVDTEAYRHNPVPGVRYMRLDLESCDLSGGRV